MLRRPLILAALITTVITTSMLAVSAHAQTPTRLADLPSTDAYRACIIQTQENPEAGFEAAIAWRDEGGGPPALHCVALALFGLGQMEEAADRLEELATEIPDASNAERASILGQAGSVWLRLRKLDPLLVRDKALAARGAAWWEPGMASSPGAEDAGQPCG